MSKQIYMNTQDNTLMHVYTTFASNPINTLKIARLKAKLPAFKVHKDTKLLIYQNRYTLSKLSNSKIWTEVEKALKLPNSDVFFNALFELGILEHIFPNLHELTTCKEGNLYHMEASVFEHTMMMLRHDKSNNIAVKLSILFHDIVKPYMHRTTGSGTGHEDEALINERLPNWIPSKLRKRVLLICKNHLKVYKLNLMSDRKIAKFFEQFTSKRSTFIDLLSLGEADANGTIISSFVSPDRRSRLDLSNLLALRDQIANYNPIPWIRTQANPSRYSISNHIHMKNIQLVKLSKLKAGFN